MVELDVLIPVYNEAENILPVLEGLRDQVRTPFRVLICYDRDTDNTLPVVRSYQASYPIELVKNPGRGVHAALMAGFRASTAPFVVVFPADDTFNAALLDAMAAKMRGGADLVAASRFLPGGTMQGCPWLKAVLVRTAAFTLRHLARLPIHDATNGFRMFSRRVLDDLAVESSQGFTYSLELAVKCHRLGWPMAEVPAQWHERTSGKSRFKVLKWLPAYLRWYGYAFATTWLFRRSVRRKQRPTEALPAG
jgi:dolichol-phosphate mannosyltransferase